MVPPSFAAAELAPTSTAAAGRLRLRCNGRARRGLDHGIEQRTENKSLRTLVLFFVFCSSLASPATREGIGRAPGCRLAATGGSLKLAAAYVVSVVVVAGIIAHRLAGRNQL